MTIKSFHWFSILNIPHLPWRNAKSFTPEIVNWSSIARTLNTQHARTLHIPAFQATILRRVPVTRASLPLHILSPWRHTSCCQARRRNCINHLHPHPPYPVPSPPPHLQVMHVHFWQVNHMVACAYIIAIRNLHPTCIRMHCKITMLFICISDRLRSIKSEYGTKW